MLTRAGRPTPELPGTPLTRAFTQRERAHWRLRRGCGTCCRAADSVQARQVLTEGQTQTRARPPRRSTVGQASRYVARGESRGLCQSIRRPGPGGQENLHHGRPPNHRGSEPRAWGCPLQCRACGSIPLPRDGRATATPSRWPQPPPDISTARPRPGEAELGDAGGRALAGSPRSLTCLCRCPPGMAGPGLSLGACVGRQGAARGNPEFSPPGSTENTAS